MGFKRRSFAILVFQGCFGVIPWRAFDFRIFFMETAGIDKLGVSIILVLGGFAGAFGGMIGGLIGDGLNKWWPLHGRVLAAEISVFGSIPIAYLTFMVYPDGATAFAWYLALTCALSLVALWPSPATNNPILCNLAAEHERSLVVAWQGSLEGAVGSLGPFIFTTLLANVFGYDPDCNREENLNRPDCQNVEAAGQALFWVTFFPWLI